MVEGEDRCTDLRDRLHSPGWRRLGISNWFIQNGRFGRQGKDLSGGCGRYSRIAGSMEISGREKAHNLNITFIAGDHGLISGADVFC